MVGGPHWGRLADAAIRNCAVFIAVISPSYGDPVASKWTYREFDRADNLGKPCLPCLVTTTATTNHINHHPPHH